MTEDQIECAVERKIDRLDARYMKGEISHDEYHAIMEQIYSWADNEYILAGVIR